MPGPVASGSRVAQSGNVVNARQPKFTFKEAKKVLKANSTNSGKGPTQKKEVGSYKVSEETKRFLSSIGVGEDELAMFISLCKTCDIGRQELSKSSLRTLFGDGDEDGAFHSYDRPYYVSSEEEDDMVVGGRQGGGGRKIRFLRKVNDVVNGDGFTTALGKKQANVLGSKHIYFITLLVTTSNNFSSQNNTRRPDTVSICLPPGSGGLHGTSHSDQDRLADLMMMKLYFVARYIYKTLQVEIESEKLTSDDRNSLRFPMIVIKQFPPNNSSSQASCNWYNIMKEKISNGEDLYAKCLVLNYCCNVV